MKTTELHDLSSVFQPWDPRIRSSVWKVDPKQQTWGRGTIRSLHPVFPETRPAGAGSSRRSGAGPGLTEVVSCLHTSSSESAGDAPSTEPGTRVALQQVATRPASSLHLCLETSARSSVPRAQPLTSLRPSHRELRLSRARSFTSRAKTRNERVRSRGRNARRRKQA